MEFLPTEVFTIIINFLDFQDARELSYCNKFLRYLVTENYKNNELPELYNLKILEVWKRMEFYQEISEGEHLPSEIPRIKYNYWGKNPPPFKPYWNTIYLDWYEENNLNTLRDFKIKELIITNCYVTDFSALSTLKNLKYLSVFCSDIFDFKDLFKDNNLPKIEYISLRYINNVKNIDLISKLPVKELYLEDTMNIINIDFIPKIKTLQLLTLSGLNIKSLDNLNKSKSLKEITISNMLHNWSGCYRVDGTPVTIRYGY